MLYENKMDGVPKTVMEWNKDGKPGAKHNGWKMFNNFIQRLILFKNNGLLVKLVLGLPGITAPLEQMFSLISNTWMDERNHMER